MRAVAKLRTVRPRERVLPKCKVMQNGCVLVGIDCPDSLAIARALVAALPAPIVVQRISDGISS